MKLPIAFAAVLVAGAAGGFFAGRASSPAPAKLSAESAEDLLLSDYLGGRAPADLTAPEVLDLLLRLNDLNIRYEGNQMEMERVKFQFGLLLQELPLPVLEQLVSMAREGGPVFGGTDPLLGHYLMRDRERALAWIGRQPNFEFMKEIAIEQLARIDTSRAVALHHQGELDSLRGDVKNLAAVTAADEVVGNLHAKKGVKAFFEFTDERRWIDIHRLLLSAPVYLPVEDIPAFIIKVRDGVEDGTYREGTLERVFMIVVQKHPAEAVKLFPEVAPHLTKMRNSLNLDGKGVMEREISMQLGYRGRFGEAAEFTKTLMPATSGNLKEWMIERINLYIVFYPELAVMLAAALPEKEQLEPIDLKYLPATPRYDQHLDKAMLLRTPAAQIQYLVEVLDAVPTVASGEIPPDLADLDYLQRRLDATSFAGEDLEPVKAAMEGARKRLRQEAGAPGEQKQD